MSVHFNLDEFKNVFEAAVREQRSARSDVSFEFGGKQIPVQGQTNLSEAVLAYLDTFSPDENFTGPEKFCEVRSDAFVDYIKVNQHSLDFMARAVHTAKLLQQATRNERPLKDFLEIIDLKAPTVKILAQTWSRGEELEKLWREYLDKKEMDGINKARLQMWDNISPE